METEKKTIKIKVPRFRIIRRTYIDLDMVLLDIAKKYLVLCVFVSPFSWWKIYEIIMGLVN